jgi:signal transduction histidine kinase
MLKVIKRLLTVINGNRDTFSYEEQLVMLYSLLCCLNSGIAIFVNDALSFGFNNVILVFTSFLFYALCYVLSRFYKKTILVKRLFSTYTFIFCDFYWLFNFGSKGSAMYFFLAYYSLMIFIWNNKQVLYITILVMLNIIVLFAIELNYPKLIPFYPSENSRIIDSYAILIMYIGLFAILVVTAKNNYIRQYKMAQQSDNLKSAFLANMSHEIRTPLNAVMGFSNLLTKPDLTKEKKDAYAKLVVDNSNYLLRIVSDILDISMIESGQMKITKQSLDIHDIFERVLLNLKQTLVQMKKEVVSVLTDFQYKKYVIETDDIRLGQVLTNLLDNAAKYTTEGFIKLGYFVEDDVIIFFVEDTGRGIREDIQPLIFTRFAKYEGDKGSNFSRGTGIGLSLSKDIVEILGGKIWFTSRYQEGSTFYFSLPK